MIVVIAIRKHFIVLVKWDKRKIMATVLSACQYHFPCTKWKYWFQTCLIGEKEKQKHRLIVIEGNQTMYRLKGQNFRADGNTLQNFCGVANILISHILLQRIPTWQLKNIWKHEKHTHWEQKNNTWLQHRVRRTYQTPVTAQYIFMFTPILWGQQWNCIRSRHACTFKEFQSDVFSCKSKRGCLHEINYLEYKYKAAGSMIIPAHTWDFISYRTGLSGVRWMASSHFLMASQCLKDTHRAENTFIYDQY